jgi:hypothetical protein
VTRARPRRTVAPHLPAAAWVRHHVVVGHSNSPQVSSFECRCLGESGHL